MPCGWKCTARSERRVFSTTIGCAPSLAYSHMYSCAAMEASHTAETCERPQRKMFGVIIQVCSRCAGVDSTKPISEKQRDLAGSKSCVISEQ